MSDGPTDINICGEALTPDPLGALYWRAQETLIVSDLHFEKGSSYAARGVMLPPYDTRTTLARLAALMRRYKPRTLISLGDAFHDGAAEARMDHNDAEILENMMKACDWIWIVGNHDPAPPQRFAADTASVRRMGQLTFRHEPRVTAIPGEIAGHLHPCARIASEGRIVRRRCFAVGGSENRERLIMPAMGAYTGGLNILDEAFVPLMKTPIAWVMGEEGVYPIKGNRLAADAPSMRKLGKTRREAAGNAG